MPSNVIDTPADEKKWKKAEDIAEKAGKGGNYAYVMGVYKGMNPDHKFKSAHKIAVRFAISDREIEQYFDWVADLHGPDIISSFGELTGDDLVQFGLDKPLRGHEDQHEKVVAMWKANKNKVRRLADRAARGRFASQQEPIQEFYDKVERGLIQRSTETEASATHIHLWFSERFSGWHIDFWADINTDGRRVWLTIGDDKRKKYTDPRKAAKAINEYRELEMELNDPDGRYASASRVALLHTKKAVWVPGEVTDDNENWQPGHYQESEQGGQGSMTPPLRGDEEKQVAEYLEKGRLAPIEEPEYAHDIEDEDEDEGSVKVAGGMAQIRQMVRIKAQVNVDKVETTPDRLRIYNISGRMWLDMGDAEIAPFRYKADVVDESAGVYGTPQYVENFRPVSGAIAGGAKNLMHFYEAALNEIISSKPALLKTARISSQTLMGEHDAVLLVPGRKAKPVYPANSRDFKLREVQKLIGGGYVEPVRLPNSTLTGEPWLMLVDEDGLMKGLRPNQEASRWARQPIVGTAVAMVSRFFK